MIIPIYRVFSIADFLLIGVAILFFWVMISGILKRSNSPIIDIRDVEMILVDKYKRYDRDHNGYDYKVVYESVDGTFETSFYTSADEYERYDVGDMVLLQEVIYKGENGVFSDIMFAREKHYKRLENYKKQSKDISDNTNSYMEEDLLKYRSKEEWVKKALVIAIAIVIGISSLVAIPGIFKIRSLVEEIGKLNSIVDNAEFTYND